MLHALAVVTVFKCAERGLVTHQLARVGFAVRSIRAPSPVLFPVNLQGACATFVELLHGGATQHFVRRNRHFQVVRELFVVLDTVLRLRNFSRAAALNAAVDDLGGHTKARNQTVGFIVIVRLPCTVDHLQHAWFWRLRIGEEEDRTRQVQPGVRHQLRFVEQRTHVAVHRFREWTVVVIVGQLFRTTTEVAQEIAVFIFTARPGLPLPDVRVTFAVITALLPFAPAHFTYVDQRLTPFGFRTPAFVAAGLLGKVGKHGGQLFAADGVAVTTVIVGLTQRREFTHGFQEVAVGIGLRAQREEIFPVAGFHNPFNALNVVRVRRPAWLNQFDLRVIQRLDGFFNRSHQREVRQFLLFLRQIAGFDGVRLTAGLLQVSSLSHEWRHAGSRNEYTQ